jgi:hypothetical protein
MKELKIGRNDDNDIVIKNQSVSRYHAIIHITDSYIVFEDLGSSNGSFINGNRVLRPTEITERSIIKVGTELVAWKNYLTDPYKKSEKIETELNPEDITDINILDNQTEIKKTDTIIEIKDENSQTLNQTNPKKPFSVTGFILSILGLFSFPFFILSIMGIMFSSIGISKEKNGLATAGLVISFISILIGIIIIFL